MRILKQISIALAMKYSTEWVFKKLSNLESSSGEGVITNAQVNLIIKKNIIIK